MCLSAITQYLAKCHCFAYSSWELRLQDEIGADFRIQEASYQDDGSDTVHRAAYLADNIKEALAAVEKEALCRRGRGKDAKPIAEVTILEPGLWSKQPDACWTMEDRIIEKQQAPFRLVAPDEAESRATFEAANPKSAQDSRQLIATNDTASKAGKTSVPRRRS